MPLDDRAKPTMPPERRMVDLTPGELANMEAEYLRGLSFVRSAVKEDAHGNPHASLWADREGRTTWLAPEGVIQAGLVDKMRAGIDYERSYGISDTDLRRGRATEDAPEPHEDVTDATEWFTEGSGADADIDGHREDPVANGWRWFVIHDNGERLIALDNKPQVRAAEPDAVPALQQAVVPLGVLQGIAQTLSS